MSTIPVNLPDFKKIDPEQIQPRIEKLLARNRQKLTMLLAQPVFTWDNLMAPLEEMNDALAKTWAPIGHLHAVLESEALRKAYNACLPLLTEYHTALAQNKELFKAIQTLRDTLNQQLDPAQHKILSNDIRDFKLSGIDLPQDKKDRIGELQKKLSELMTKFSENLLDATHAYSLHITEKNELAGLPEEALALAAKEAKKRNLPGYVLTLDYPSYSAAMKFLHARELRKTLYEAYVTRASELGPNALKWDNSTVMTAILQTRHEIANLVGFANYAEYSLATKMAKTAKRVLDFFA